MTGQYTDSVTSPNHLGGANSQMMAAVMEEEVKMNTKSMKRVNSYGQVPQNIDTTTRKLEKYSLQKKIHD
jgi:hypothetical protein